MLFHSLIPKHKHTEKMRVQVKKQISTLKEQIEEEKRRKKIGHSGKSWFIEKHGAAQVAMIGLTKSGKSSLLSKVTNAKPLISSHPFTTTEPIAGMLEYQDIAFQLIEAPSLQLYEEESWNAKIISLARNADGLIIMINLEDDAVQQFRFISDTLEMFRMTIEKTEARVIIERKNVTTGVQMLGMLTDATLEDVRQLLNSYKIFNAIVKIYGHANLDNVEEAIFEGSIYKPSIILANKIDTQIANTKVKYLEDLIDQKIEILKISCITGRGLNDLGLYLFKILEIMRVYTKLPSNKEPSIKPILMKANTSVLDVAKKIHSAFYKNLSYAKIWGKSAKYDGERVGSEHILQDGDIVELHMK